DPAIAFYGSYACVMPGGDKVSPQGHRVIKKSLELDLGVTQNVRIGRASGGVFTQKLRKHAVLVFGGKVDRLDLDPNYVRDARRVQPVLTTGAVFAVVIVFPVLHEQAQHVIALLFEQPRGNG